MHSAELRAALQHSPLFDGIALDSIARQIDAFGYRQFAAGEAVLCAGQANSFVYVLLSGVLGVRLAGRVQALDDPLEPGDCLGEISALDGKGASGDVIATSPVEVLVIPQSMLWELIDTCPGFARNLLYILSARLRSDNRTLIETQHRSELLRQAASLDGLTGVHNRRWMDESFPRVFGQRGADAAPVCLVMADIDHFKRVNDRYGHGNGDRVLCAVAGALKASRRDGDLLARYGGEEFALLLPNTRLPEGREVAERLREAVQALQIETDQGQLVSVTLSCGIAEALPGSALPVALAAADAALYLAKQRGRNRVELAEAAVSKEAASGGSSAPSGGPSSKLET